MLYYLTCSNYSKASSYAELSALPQVGAVTDATHCAIQPTSGPSKIHVFDGFLFSWEVEEARLPT